MKKLIFIIAIFASNLWANNTEFANEKFKDIRSIMGINKSCVSQKEIQISQPNQSDDFILDFAHIAVLSSYTYNFVSLEEDLKLASLFYTQEAWKKFKENSEQVIEAIITKKLVSSAAATKLPTITTKGIADGRYHWEIQIPLLVIYQSSTQYTSKNIEIKLTVTRVDPNVNPEGIAITGFNISEPVYSTTNPTSSRSTIQPNKL